MKNRFPFLIIFTTLLLFIGLFMVNSSNKAASQVEDRIDEVKAVRESNFSRLISDAKSKGSVRVIIGLDLPISPIGTLSRLESTKQLDGIKGTQQSFLGRYAHRSPKQVSTFKYMPFVVMEVDADTLESMRNDSQVKSLEEDVPEAPHLAESSPLIGASTAWDSNNNGAGWAVAVLDSGVKSDHEFLAGKVVSEACYSLTNAPNNSVSVCPGEVQESTATGSGTNCDLSIAGCSHGTHVAGIAAGKGPVFSGVAKEANIIAIQVFAKFTSSENCGATAPPCALSFVSDQIKGLERVLTLSSSINIAAVNMSLGGGRYYAHCDVAQAARKTAIDNLRSVNIPTVISSGNNGYPDSIGAPACISSAISVGSTGDGSSGATLDSVVSSSNSAPFLSILAPGRWITSSIANSTNSYSAYSGTSMASPQVAGSFAVLKQKYPTMRYGKLLKALKQTGTSVTDSKNGVATPRINIDSALASTVYDTGFDYDADGSADLTVFRPGNSTWYLQQATAGYVAMTWGIEGDKIAPADYDGDGKTDVAVFRPSTGTWYIHLSESGAFQTFGWGADGDVPLPADRDGDGKADLVVFRPSTNTWYTRFSKDNSFGTTAFGNAGDKPVPGDYDGDGKSDIAVFRPSNSNWYILKSGSGYFIQTWGEGGDIPVPADYDGDGTTDLAVFRPSLGRWYKVESTDGVTMFNWGQSGDLPIPADYDGDGKVDLAVFRPSNSRWYFYSTSTGYRTQDYGQGSDIPTPNAYIYPDVQETRGE